MKLYHGSNVVVEKPRLLRSDRRLDFGAGFYLTSSFEQAKRWAVLTARRRETGSPLVSVFDFDEQMAKGVCQRQSKRQARAGRARHRNRPRR